MTKKLELTMACGLYDRMLDLYRGDVRPDGITLNFIPMDGSAGAREIFDRMAGNLEFDVAEMSSSEFIARKSAGQTSLVALPVFPSRVFRHGMCTVNRRSGIKSPKDLEGKRVGLPIYTMSAAVWMKGHLQHDYGVDISKIASPRWIATTRRVTNDRPSGAMAMPSSSVAPDVICSGLPSGKRWRQM